MPPEAADWYDTPLYYDIVFESDTKQEADFLEAAMRLYGNDIDETTTAVEADLNWIVDSDVPSVAVKATPNVRMLPRRWNTSSRLMP